MWASYGCLLEAREGGGRVGDTKSAHGYWSFIVRDEKEERRGLLRGFGVLYFGGWLDGRAYACSH